MKYTRKDAGFTLIELTFAISLVAAVISGIIISDENVHGLGRERTTQMQLERIQRALNNYVVTNGYYPCPADGDLATGNANYGVGQGSNTGTCVDMNFSSVDADPTRFGVVPIKDLGLNYKDMLDAWGNRIGYAVKQSLTASSTYSAGTADITVLNDYTEADDRATNISAHTLTNTAAYLLISFGADGAGAYPAGGGTRRTAQAAGSDYVDSIYQQNNHHLHSSATLLTNSIQDFDGVFVRPATRLDDKSTPVQFDDLIVYGAKVGGGCSSPDCGTLPVSDPIFWVDACAICTITESSGSVSAWSNKGTIGGSATASGGDQPTTGTRSLNGRNVIDFDGTNEMKTGDFSSSYAQGNTIFIVAKRDSLGDGTDARYLYDASESASDRHAVYVDSTDEVYAYGGGTSLNTGTASLASTDPEVTTVTYNTTSSELRINGRYVESDDAGSDDLTGFTLGNKRADNGDSNLDGYIAEVIAYDSVLTCSQIKSVQEYLADKWNLGLDSSTPSTTSLEIWLDADDMCTLTLDGSNKVSNWADKSGNGNDVTNGMSVNYPQALSVYQNNRHAIYFDNSSSDVLENESLSTTLSSPYTVFLAGHMHSYSDYLFSGGVYNPSLMSRSDGRTCFFNSTQKCTAFGTNMSVDPSIWTVVFDGGAAGSQLYENGTALLSNQSTGTDGMSGITVAARYDEGSRQTGDYYELLAFDADVDGDDRKEIESYLAYKWGIEIPMPITANQVLWLDGSDSSTLFTGSGCTGAVSDGSSVACWQDQSGNGNDVTQAGAPKPVFTNSIQNGKSIVRFTSDELTIADNTDIDFLDGYSILAVVANSDEDYGSDAEQILVDKTDYALSLNDGNGRGTIVSTLNGTDTATNSGMMGDENVFSVITVTVANAGGGDEEVNVYHNGRLKETATVTPASSNTGDNLSIGDSSTGSAPFQGDIAELMIYDTELSKAQRQALEGYLGAKWDIKGMLVGFTE